MPSPARANDPFRYLGYSVDPVLGQVRCTYAAGPHTFVEQFTFGRDRQWDNPAVDAAVRILFLLAAVSYYKCTAAPVIDLGTTATTAEERAILSRYFRHGLGEFAYRNGIDLSDLAFVGPDRDAASVASYAPEPQRPLIPFGGGIDSIVTVDAIGRGRPGAALCVVHPPGDMFAAISEPAKVTGLSVTTVERELSPLVRRSGELGFLNGHVPITAIIMATAVVAAVLDGRDAVVLSNEQSASVPTLVVQGNEVNHQWSKGVEFERDFARLVAVGPGPGLSVFSYLRCRSELWVARQFSGLTDFHGSFRSCNRAFHQDAALRLDHWCGVCDKCCFIDLILAPFMAAGDLRAVFGGNEPLDNPALGDTFRTLLGLTPDDKPFECVGDTSECRAAAILASARPDRRGTAQLQTLRSLIEATPEGSGVTEDLFAPIGPHYIPDGYAPPDLLA